MASQGMPDFSPAKSLLEVCTELDKVIKSKRHLIGGLTFKGISPCYPHPSGRRVNHTWLTFGLHQLKILPEDWKAVILKWFGAHFGLEFKCPLAPRSIEINSKVIT